MNKPRLYLIGGPTASGKSALAIKLAARENGIVINTDAMQVYSQLPLLTAQPDKKDTQIVSHLLYEVFEPNIRSSAGVWLDAAQKALTKATELGKTPIFVGGTGLYFKALTEGLANIPETPEPIRAQAAELYDKIGTDAFRETLAKVDSESATRLKPNDKQRLVRAYEVVLNTGKPLSYWHSQSAQQALTASYNIEAHLLLPPRENLYKACDTRFLRMMEQGALREVKSLLALNLPEDMPAMKILGVSALAAFLNNELSYAEAITLAQQHTRNYAKRQVTWFKNQWEKMPFPVTIHASAEA